MKVVGRVMNAEEAKEEEAKGNFCCEGRRRLPPYRCGSGSRSQSLRSTRSALADADQPVIAAGGGGILVMEQGSHLKGASAVIEKDRAAGLPRRSFDADVLMFITGVPNVVLNYGSDHPINIDKMTTADAARLCRGRPL